MRYIREISYSVCIQNFRYKDFGPLTAPSQGKPTSPDTGNRYWFVTSTIYQTTMAASDCNRFPRTCTMGTHRLNRTAFHAIFLAVTQLATRSGTTSITRTCWPASHRAIHLPVTYASQ